MTSPGSTFNLIPVLCDDAAEYLRRNRTRLCIARSYIDRELLLEVDDGDARFCSDVAFLNVDLGTCESESEKKKSRSAALITHDTDLVHPVGTKDKVRRTPNVLGTQHRQCALSGVPVENEVAFFNIRGLKCDEW